jgi:hypothetical protein
MLIQSVNLLQNYIYSVTIILTDYQDTWLIP